jgi:ribosomal protein S18 acetylase RimI-like enzyme
LHSPEIALIHLNELKYGFLSTLGLKFLIQLYNKIIKKGILLVSIEDDRINGFVSFSPNTKKLIVGFIFSSPGILMSLFSNFLRNPDFLRKSIETFKAPFKSSQKNLDEGFLPRAELLSIAVDSATQKSGIGFQMLNALENEIKKIGIKEYKVIAGANLESANKFYLKNGFTQAMQIRIHGHDLSNVYIKKL